MELQQMRYVVAVAETNSFTRAAERCLVVQSALSHQIARLERELGARLFDRTSRRVRLTAAGAAFLPVARQCLAAADRAVAEVAAAIGEVRGPLRVGLIPTVAAVDVPSALAEFRRRHPRVRIALRVGGSDTLTRQVRDGDLDIALLGLPDSTPPTGVAARELARDRLVAVVAPDHPLATASAVDLRRLCEEVFVDLPEGTPGRNQSDLAFSAAGLHRDVAFEVSTVDALMARLVAKGLGIALLASTYAPQLPGLTTVEIADAPTRVEWVVWSATGSTPAANAFLDILGAARSDSPSPATATETGVGDVP
ncbi:MAG TPA: LysR family transcriptional regulator [Nocardia sp.]|uniref:LysR family transcriptional regulator n=1 Tax=Nocardia sp. TaxID=1821 RepID=UPI002B4B7010|nr:LysR family transcriptional regulator [Nocardia sp.]HLS78193.1 LysR family transcriptional regulator [Nocardia sp.]